MITEKFIIFISIGTTAMLIPLILYGIWNKVNLLKSISVAILLTLTGTAGTYLMGFIENDFRFGSRSFYGAVFLIPIVFLAIAKTIKVTARSSWPGGD